MPYVDLNTLHNPATGNVAPAAWGDGVRDNFEFLIDPPACSVFNSVAEGATNGVTKVLSADSENYDNFSGHSTVTNNSRITITTPGRYFCFSLVQFAVNSAGLRRVSFLVNGSTSWGAHQAANAGNTDLTRLPGVRTLTLTTGDYVEATCFQNSGGSLFVGLDEFMVMFMTR